MGSPGEADRDALPGRRLADRYQVERLVARGGMAHVYRARDERLDRPVALKVLASPYADDSAYVRRFLEEARIAASITHPNLAHVYDSGEDHGVRFIVMELLEGHRSLRDELTERGRLPVPEAVRVIRDVLAGLSPLHARGLVHCDVKPGNVLMGPNGAKLIDFGIARPQRRQRAGPTSIGSLHSMSPEQLRGDPLTPASDIFAVGVALYCALTGRVPFAGDSPAAVAGAQAAGAPVAPDQLAPDVPELLSAAVLQALHARPEHRFESAAAMDAALDAATKQTRVPIAATPALPDDDTTSFVPVVRSPASRPRRPPGSSHSRAAVLVAFGTLLAVAILVAAIVVGGLGERNQPAEAITSTPTATPTRNLAAGKVKVPDTIGMSEADAERAARGAGLAWRLEWRVDPSRPAGVYDQDPPAGTMVEDGAPFVMYAYRTR
jgi:serine/threonine protein kinase